MKKRCAIYVLTDKGEVQAGLVELQDGKVIVTVLHGQRRLMKNLLHYSVKLDGVTYSSKLDAAKWFEILPRVYHGTYISARMV